MSDGTSTTPGRALAVRPVTAAWVLTVGVDLFFNAGLFMPLFDQQREPNLLPDALLFRRIPVAYLALLIGVTALAWVLDRADVSEPRLGSGIGAAAGVVFALMGVVYVWTAIDMSTTFVLAGSVVLIVEFATAGWVLTAFRSGADPKRLTRWALLVAFGAAAVGIVIQNLSG